MDSMPITLAVLPSAQPADRAHGLINNSPAPAEPERVGFPAQAVAAAVKIKTANELFIIKYF
jgi:hypothetical protein